MYFYKNQDAMQSRLMHACLTLVFTYLITLIFGALWQRTRAIRHAQRFESINNGK